MKTKKEVPTIRVDNNPESRNRRGLNKPLLTALMVSVALILAACNTTSMSTRKPVSTPMPQRPTAILVTEQPPIMQLEESAFNYSNPCFNINNGEGSHTFKPDIDFICNTIVEEIPDCVQEDNKPNLKDIPLEFIQQGNHINDFAYYSPSDNTMNIPNYEGEEKTPREIIMEAIGHEYAHKNQFKCDAILDNKKPEAIGSINFEYGDTIPMPDINYGGYCFVYTSEKQRQLICNFTGYYELQAKAFTNHTGLTASNLGYNIGGLLGEFNTTFGGSLTVEELSEVLSDSITASQPFSNIAESLSGKYGVSNDEVLKILFKHITDNSKNELMPIYVSDESGIRMPTYEYTLEQVQKGESICIQPKYSSPDIVCLGFNENTNYTAYRTEGDGQRYAITCGFDPNSPNKPILTSEQMDWGINAGGTISSSSYNDYCEEKKGELSKTKPLAHVLRVALRYHIEKGILGAETIVIDPY